MNHTVDAILYKNHEVLYRSHTIHTILYQSHKVHTILYQSHAIDDIASRGLVSRNPSYIVARGDKNMAAEQRPRGKIQIPIALRRERGRGSVNGTNSSRQWLSRRSLIRALTRHREGGITVPWELFRISIARPEFPANSRRLLG